MKNKDIERIDKKLSYLACGIIGVFFTLFGWIEFRLRLNYNQVYNWIAFVGIIFIFVSLFLYLKEDKHGRK